MSKGKGPGLGGAILKIIERTGGYFVPGGQQVQMIISNQSSVTLERAGSNVGAGTTVTHGGKHFTPPETIAPEGTGVILIDSSGWSSQVCSEYGFDESEDGTQWQLMLFYGYNPKDDVDNYAGLHNPVLGGGTIGRKQWEEAKYNQGRYAGNRICADANEGYGPDWQINVTENPTNRFKLGNLRVELSCSREESGDGSRLVAVFVVRDA